jgi:hypothetical protein
VGVGVVDPARGDIPRDPDHTSQAEACDLLEGSE